MFHLIRTLTLLILLSIGGSTAAQTLVDSIIAVVNEDAITRSELEDEFRFAFLIGLRSDTMPTAAEKRATLGTLIDRTFVLQEAERRGIVVREGDTQIAARISEIAANTVSEIPFQSLLVQLQLEVGAVKTRVHDQRVYDEFYRRIFFNAVSSEEVARLAKAYYETNRSEFIVPPTVTLKSLRILTPKNGTTLEKQAARTLLQELNARLQRGETFQRVYEVYKTAAALTYEVLTLAVDTPMGRIVTDLQVFEPSTPIPISDGYQIVERIRNNPAYQQTYEEAREEITDRIRGQLAETAFETWLLRRKNEATWHIFDDEFEQEQNRSN